MIALLALALAAQPLAVQPMSAQPVADAERAFAAAAQRDGQWTAFRATAAPDAVMFAPGMVKAHIWLQGRADPAQAIAWAPTDTLTACDGSLAISVGGWVDKAAKTQGTFTTVWRHGADGWRWQLDQGHDTPRAIATPAAVKPRRPACTNLSSTATSTDIMPADTIVVQRDNAMPDADIAAVMTAGDEDWPTIAAGHSDDGSLKWEAHGDPKSNAHSFAVYRWGGAGYLLDRIEVNRR